MSNIKTFAIISDIHYSDSLAGALNDELEKCFLTYLKKNKEKLSAVFFAGDTFHSRIGFNSITAFSVLNFIKKTLKILEDVPLVIIRGTRSHDYNQLETFKFLEDEGLTIVNTFDGFEIDGAKVLCLPEEYVTNADKYYNFDEMEKFDLIVMHGMIDFAAYTSNSMESEKEVPSAVTFKSSTLSKLATVVVAGHVHMPLDYKNIHYCNSFTRFCFGENEDKGFVEVKIDITRNKYKLNRIINTYAPIYKTLDLSSIYSDDIGVVVNEIKKAKKQAHEVRLQVDMEVTKDVEGVVAVLREKFGSSFKIKLTRIKRKKIEEEIPPEVVKILHEKIDIKQTIASLIKQSNPEVNLTPEEVGLIISK